MDENKRTGKTLPGLDPQLVGEPLEGEDGKVYRPIQQNVGYDAEAGGGEWPDPTTPPRLPAPGAAKGSEQGAGSRRRRPLMPSGRRDQRPGQIEHLAQEAAACRNCDLWQSATQTVFGAGSPAGQVLDHALAEAGIDRHDVYATNPVKHFKWKAQGKRRPSKLNGQTVVATIHPSAVLRAGDGDARQADFQGLVADLRRA